MVRIASFNVENLFERPKAFNTANWSIGKPALDAYREVNAPFINPACIRGLLVALDIYSANSNGTIRRNLTQSPRWAWLGKNRVDFDREPTDPTQNFEIDTNGRDDRIGWIELAKELTTETSIRMTARVIKDVGADIIGIVEAEDRPYLVRFNKEMLGGLYRHVMLVDGNDDCGIDVGIMTADNFEVESIRSNVDTEDAIGTVFSRDCPQYQVRKPNGTVLHILVNHFKAKSGDGVSKRRCQAMKCVESSIT
jgi:hypothetical protein